ncbi:alanine aminotransferase 1 isoform X1 [Daphnia magna]|uniref:alanine aminotransferase 1 isoform X1 n=1 Tax=Daphnia magna TaxID=35525 RepID=UPI001E1BC62D|nr:alanine aminotransferase 1 isoform X1 [Daphnia magna]
MQAFWLGHQRGVVQSTFRKWRLQNRPPVSTVPTVVVASRSIVTPTQCLESQTSSSLPSRQRSISSPFDHQPTTAPTTLLFSPAAKKQHSVSHFHTHSCQLAQSRKGDLIGREEVIYVRRAMATLAAQSHVDLVLNVDNINPNVKAMEYAVRGPLVIRAGEIEKELAMGVKKPFTEVIKANIGDAQAMGQKPITFIRQVLSLVAYPDLLNSKEFPEDVKSRARAILESSRGSAGCYSDSAGLELVRNHVAQYIERRDGFPADPNNIVLCAGASEGIRSTLKMLSTVSGPRTGIMIPIPQYPLYSASIVEYNMEQAGYYLNEDNDWGLDVSELERAVNEARKRCNVRGIVVINPGNPTGQVLTRDNIVEVIKFAHREKLFIFADEVYQDNVYAHNRKFHSFKKVTKEMGDPYDKLELASFLSCSKGYMGECGLRGGYAEIVNMDPAVKALYLKSISAKLCPTVLGQAVMDCVVNPPQPGEPSYELFSKEKAAVLQSLSERASMIAKSFNSIPGIKCNTVQGAMYAFPEVKIPEKAIAKAKSLGQAPDVFYAFQLLEQTGMCCVPGSGFGQRPGTYHFRTTILPQPEKLQIMLDKFRSFQESFMKEYQ